MPFPENERERLEALINFNILEKMPEAELDAIVKTAALICQTQVAMISIFEGEKHHIKSSVGLNIYDLRGDFDFCHLVLREQSFVEIPDAYLDAELMKKPMVIGHPNFRFFAGIPITTERGMIVGSLCVIGTKAGHLNAEQAESLQDLGRQIVHLLELRKQNKNLQSELNQLLHERINQTEIDLAAYKFALDQSSGVAIADRNGYIKFVNDKFCKSSGYIKEELLGQSYNILNSKHHNARFFHDMWETILHGELWHGEIRNKDKQGNFFWVDCSIIPFLDKKGKPYQFMAIQQDITEKKSAQERMTLETRLISILSKNDAIDISVQHIAEQICYRLEWDIGIYWSVQKGSDVLSPGMYYQFTYPHNDILRQYILASRIRINEGLPGKVWEKKKPSWVYDLGYEPQQNEHALVTRFNMRSALLFPVMFNNEVTGVMEFLSARHKKPDISILQMFESSGLQIGAFIERKIAEEELLKAKKQAEESVISKDQFLANMSHEIRTPMNAIIGFTELLSQTKLNEQQKEYAGSVKVAGENLLSIINDILDFSKIESGVISIESAPSDLHQIMKNVYDLLKIGARQKALEFSYQFDDRIPTALMCDALRLNQILINLVGNAIKFTEKGSVHFSAILIESENNKHHIRFSIRDTGIGIHDEKKEKIFERFTQVNNEINRKYEGTGLGLSISKNLIELQGGKLELHSQEGIGSEFLFSLWMEHGHLDEVIKEDFRDLKSRQIHQNKILIIEDNFLNQKLAKNVLNNFGFEVELAFNGQIGLEMLRHQQYDLVLMDLQMPELDGYQTTRIIRNNMKLMTPIIAMTAHSIVGEKEKCLAAGMNDFISKPFNPDELYNKIASKLTSEAMNKNMSNPVQLAGPLHRSINLSYLHELSGGNAAFEHEIIALFVQQLPQELSALKRAIQNENSKQISDITHKLKSSLDIFGREDLSDVLSSLSNDAKENNNKEQMLTKLSEAESALNAFYPSLQEHIHNTQNQ